MGLENEIEDNIRNGTSIIFLKGFIKLARIPVSADALERALIRVGEKFAREQEQEASRKDIARAKRMKNYLAPIK